MEDYFLGCKELIAYLGNTLQTQIAAISCEWILVDKEIDQNCIHLKPPKLH